MNDALLGARGGFVESTSHTYVAQQSGTKIISLAIVADLDFQFPSPKSATEIGHRSDFKLDNWPPKLAKCLHTKIFFYTTVLYLANWVPVQKQYPRGLWFCLQFQGF